MSLQGAATSVREIDLRGSLVTRAGHVWIGVCGWLRSYPQGCLRGASEAA